MTAQYRADGWPLCPRCGADELWSSSLKPAPAHNMTCLACGWIGCVPLKLKPDPDARLGAVEP